MKKTLLIIFTIFVVIGTAGMLSNASTTAKLDKATFAGGCFWCMMQPVEKLKRVKEVIAGYTAVHTVNPTYEDLYLKQQATGKPWRSSTILRK